MIYHLPNEKQCVNIQFTVLRQLKSHCKLHELPHKLCPRRRCTVSLQRLHRLLHKTVQKEVQSYCKDSTDVLTKLCRRRYTVSLQSLCRLPHKLCPEGSRVNMKKKKDSFFLAFWQTLPSINPKGNVSSECTSLKHKELTT
jgi:hypothetical protein